MSNDTQKSPSTNPNALVRALKTDSFVEKALLLVITAVLSGIVIPLTFKSIDVARESRAGIARAQAKLFDDISETILTAETLVLDVSWFGTSDARNQVQQKAAFERYSTRIVDLVAKWRAQTARAQALASPVVAKKLDAFLGKFFLEQDTPLNQLWTRCGTECDVENWQNRHNENHAALDEANALILELALDLGLKRN